MRSLKPKLLPNGNLAQREVRALRFQYNHSIEFSAGKMNLVERRRKKSQRREEAEQRYTLYLTMLATARYST